MKPRGFHQANHVGRGIYRRQFGMVSGERVLEFDRFFAGSTRAYGNFFHAPSQKTKEPMIVSIARPRCYWPAALFNAASNIVTLNPTSCLHAAFHSLSVISILTFALRRKSSGAKDSLPV